MFCKERTQYLFLGIISTTQTYRKKEIFLILQNTHKIFYVKFILNSSLHAVDDGIIRYIKILFLKHFLSILGNKIILFSFRIIGILSNWLFVVIALI